jgi:ubiquitin-like-conjugating enzyme ATG10
VEVEEEDVATVQASVPPPLTVHEYIIYSASFNVPAFYFTVHDSSECASPIDIKIDLDPFHEQKEVPSLCRK